MRTESLGFTVKPVKNDLDLQRACQIRAEAYGRKDADFRDSMAVPDAIDSCPGTTSYLCEEKATGRSLGTMRVQTTATGKPLEIEKYFKLPSALENCGRAEITRLSTICGADPLVRIALWKAGYLHCLARDLRWIVLGVRKPGLLRAYEQMGSREIAEPIALPYAGNKVHRVLGLEIEPIKRDWIAHGHRLLAFMYETRHPDISVLGNVD